MKKILFTALFAIAAIFSFSQSNYVPYYSRVKYTGVAVDGTFHVPHGSAPTLGVGGWNAPGALYYDLTDSTLKVWTGYAFRSSSLPSKYVDSIYRKAGTDSIFLRLRVGIDAFEIGIKDSSGVSGNFISNQSSNQTGAIFNVDRGLINQAQPSEVTTLVGTTPASFFNAIGAKGGNSSYSGASATGGTGSTSTITAGIGGDITGSPTLGTGGKGGDVTINGGTGGFGGGTTSVGGKGGTARVQGGDGGFGTNGGDGGNAALKGGNAFTTGSNRDGGNVYIIGGKKAGSGNDGNILLGVSESIVVRGNIGVRTSNPTANFHSVGTVRLDSLGVTTSDTSMYKPLVADASGNVKSFNQWPVGSGGGSGQRFGVAGEDDIATADRAFNSDGTDFTLYGSSNLYLQSTGTASLEVPGSSSFVAGSSNDLYITAGNYELTAKGDTASSNRRISYTGNIHSAFTKHSLVDKDYIDSLLATIEGSSAVDIGTTDITNGGDGRILYDSAGKASSNENFKWDYANQKLVTYNNVTNGEAMNLTIGNSAYIAINSSVPGYGSNRLRIKHGADNINFIADNMPFNLSTGSNSYVLNLNPGGSTVLKASNNTGDYNVDVTGTLRATSDFRLDGAFKPGNDEGSSGQVLTSQGSGSYPVWTDAPTSGEITPTFTNTTNITSSAASDMQYYRIGDRIHCFGEATIQPTSTGAVELRISLPFSSGFSATAEAAGNATCATTGEHAAINAVVAGGSTVALKYISTSTTSNVFSYEFSYKLTSP